MSNFALGHTVDMASRSKVPDGGVIKWVMRGVDGWWCGGVLGDYCDQCGRL